MAAELHCSSPILLRTANLTLIGVTVACLRLQKPDLAPGSRTFKNKLLDIIGVNGYRHDAGLSL